MTRGKGDLISAACLASFGVYVISVAAKLPYVSDVGPGPGFFPIWLGIGLVLLGCLQTVAAFFDPAKLARGESQSWKTTGRALAGWLAMMVAVALLGRIGFTLSFTLLTVFLIVVLDRRPVSLAVVVGIGLALGFHLIFVTALEISLPAGRWGF